LDEYAEVFKKNWMNMQKCLKIKKLCTYTVKHNNVFFALLATSFGPYGHLQANIVQKFEKSF
jgi:hypothetical protein